MIVYGKHFEKGRDFGDLYVQTANHSYHPGETVSGTIFLNLYRPYPGDDLKLKIKGLEKTCLVWHTEESNYDPIKGVEVRIDKEQITPETAVCLHQKVKIYDFKGQVLEPGQYSFPFSFKLPLYIPGTFHHIEHRLKASVTYTIEAYLDAKGDVFPKINYKSRFTVREAPEIKGGDNYKLTAFGSVKTCGCCKDYGTVRVTASLDKNIYVPGNTVKVLVEVDNSQSSAAVDSVSFQLRQFITIKALSKTEFRSHVVAQATNSAKIQAKQGLTAVEFTFTLPKSPLVSDAFSKDPLMLKRAPAYQGQFISSTTHGKLITSRFALHARASPDVCCAGDVEVVIPCHIVYPAYALPPFKQPEKWAPKMMPAVVIPVSLNPTYPIYMVPSDPSQQVSPSYLAQNQSVTPGYPTQTSQPTQMNIGAPGPLTYGTMQDGNTMGTQPTETTPFITNP